MIRQRRPAGPIQQPRWPVEVLGPDNPINRRETIARLLLDELRRRDPAKAHEFVTLAAALGDTWLGREQDLAPVEQIGGLTRAQVAARAGLPADTGPAAVTMWATRGIRRGGHTIRLRPHADRYDPEEVDDFLRLYHDRAAVPAMAAEHPRQP